MFLEQMYCYPAVCLQGMRKSTKNPADVRKRNLPNTKGRILNVLANLLGQTVGTFTYRIHAISKLSLNRKERKHLHSSLVPYTQHNKIN
jgi:hypothetical protein